MEELNVITLDYCGSEIMDSYTAFRFASLAQFRSSHELIAGIYKPTFSPYIALRNLPEIPPHTCLKSAYLKFEVRCADCASQYSQGQLSLYKVMEPWEDTDTNNLFQPAASACISSITIPVSSEYNRFQMDITELVDDWHRNGNNYGVALKNTSDYFYSVMYIKSSKSDSSPVFEITYCDS